MIVFYILKCNIYYNYGYSCDHFSFWIVMTMAKYLLLSALWAINVVLSTSCSTCINLAIYLLLWNWVCIRISLSLFIHVYRMYLKIRDPILFISVSRMYNGIFYTNTLVYKCEWMALRALGGRQGLWYVWVSMAFLSDSDSAVRQGFSQTFTVCLRHKTLDSWDWVLS